MLTYHLVPVTDYDPGAPAYTPRDFQTEGFVHTSRTLDALAGAGNRYYRDDRRHYLVLTIDLDRLDSPWRYDAAGALFPHVYGAIQCQAIVAVHRAERAADGTFRAHLGDMVE